MITILVILAILSLFAFAIAFKIGTDTIELETEPVVTEPVDLIFTPPIDFGVGILEEDEGTNNHDQAVS